MVKVKIARNILILLVLVGCNKTEDVIEKKNDLSHLEFSKNILNFKVSPKDSLDKSGLMFSDQGAWFAYAFPDSSEQNMGFTGPFLMTQQNGVWSSKSLSQLEMSNFKKPIISSQNAYSSHLSQVLDYDTISHQQDLVFLSGHTALIKHTFFNKSKNPEDIQLHSNMEFFDTEFRVSSNKNRIKISSPHSNAMGYFIFLVPTA